MNANCSAPHIDPEAPLQFVINAAAGSNAAENKRQLIEAALQATQRQGNLIFSDPANLAQVARQAADLAIAKHSAVVAVGGDGTINTVAQAAHALSCPMGSHTTRHLQLLCPHAWDSKRSRHRCARTFRMVSLACTSRGYK